MDPSTDFDAALKACRASASARNMRNLLTIMRKRNIRQPRIVIKYGSRLVKGYSGSLGDELWLVHEMLVLAYIDVADLEMAKEHRKKLDSKFPESMRVMRLSGMMKEAQKDFVGARATYEKMQKQNPANRLARKRLVACLRAQGKRNGAIESLVSYLKLFPSDPAAWEELAALYMEAGRYKLAAFCYEELITCAPMNPDHHTTYAELLYTSGREDFSNLTAARQYFAQSLELKTTGNCRALVGILMSSAAVATTKAGRAKQKSDPDNTNSQMHAFAKNDLLERYNKAGGAAGEIGNLVAAVLERQSRQTQNA